MAMGESFQAKRYSYVPVSDPTRMAEQIMQYAPATDAEALKLLRTSFPNYPLSARVAALDFLMRRPLSGASYIPK
jgi:hypothetical protein